MTERARPLPCRTEGCPGVLGWVRGGVLRPRGAVHVYCDVPAGRCELVCPACGRRGDWRDRLEVPRRRPKPAA